MIGGFTHGMNVEVVKSIGNQLQGIADNDINDLITRIGTIITNALENWSGPDSTQFSQEWETTHRQALITLQSALRTYGQKAITNAGKQEEASRQYQ